MTWLLKLKTAYKLALGFGICLILASVIAVASLQQILQLSTVTNSISGDSMISLTRITALRGDLKSYRLDLYQLISSTTPQQRQDAETDMAVQQAGLEKSLSDSAATMIDPDEIAHIHALQDAWQANLDLTPMILEASQKNDIKSA